MCICMPAFARCEVCQASEKAPRAPAVGTSTVALSNEKLQVDLLFLDNIIARDIMDVYSKYSRLIPVRAKNPQEAWGAFRSSWIGIFGLPWSIQLDEGGEWKNEL